MALKFNLGLQNYYGQPGCYPANRIGMGSCYHPLVGLNFAHRLLRLSAYTDNTHLLQELHGIVKILANELAFWNELSFLHVPAMPERQGCSDKTTSPGWKASVENCTISKRYLLEGRTIIASKDLWGNLSNLSYTDKDYNNGFFRCNRATGRPGQRPTGIVPFNIVILFRGQNYNERGTALLRFIATGEPGR